MPEHPWSRHIFSLIMPDAITRHLHLPIVDRMAGAGFVVRFAKVMRVRPELLDELNAVNIKRKWDSYRYRLLDKLFLFGPVIALVCEDVSGGAEDSHVRAKRLKGATDPRFAADGTIRRDLGGINAMLAFMHAADTPERSLFESRLFLGEGAVPQDYPLEGSAADGTDWDSARVLFELLAYGAAEHRCFDAVVHDLRAAALAVSWDDLSPAGRKLAACNKDFLAGDSLGAELADTLRLGSRHPAHGLLRAVWQPGGHSLTERDLLRARAALELPADPWADMVLLTSSAFAPRRGDRVATNAV
jgi:nucleoside diphosphate kinase